MYKILCPHCGESVALNIEKQARQLVASKIEPPPPEPVAPENPPDERSAIHEIIESDSDDGPQE